MKKFSLEIENMKKVDIKTVNRDELADIKDVKKYSSMSKAERTRDFIEQINNPYCYKCGKCTVKLIFNDNEKTMEEKLNEYLMSV